VRKTVCILAFLLVLTGILGWFSLKLAFLPDGVTFYNTGSGKITAQDLQYLRSLGWEVSGWRETDLTVTAPSGRAAAVTARYVDTGYFYANPVPMTLDSPEKAPQVVLSPVTAMSLYQSEDCKGLLLAASGVTYTADAVYDDRVGLLADGFFARMIGRRPVLFLPLPEGETALDAVQIVTDLTPDALLTSLDANTRALLGGYTAVRCRTEALFFTSWWAVYLVLLMLALVIWVVGKLVTLRGAWHDLTRGERVLEWVLVALGCAGVIAGLWLLPRVLPESPAWFTLPANIFDWGSYGAQIRARLYTLGRLPAHLRELRIAVLYGTGCVLTMIVTVVYSLIVVIPGLVARRVR